MSRTLVVLNDPPYHSERDYNGLRLAISLAKRPGEEVRVFLMGDAIACAKRGQQSPDGRFNIEQMLTEFASLGGQVCVCGGYMKARGMTAEDLAEGCRQSTLVEWTDFTLWAEKTLVF